MLGDELIVLNIYLGSIDTYLAQSDNYLNGIMSKVNLKSQELLSDCAYNSYSSTA